MAQNKMKLFWIVYLLVLPSIAFAALQTSGPINQNNGFPTYYTDNDGLTLALCMDPGNTYCLAAPVDTASQFSQQIGFGEEAFWWAAETTIEIPPGGALSQGGQALLVQAVEAAFPTTLADGGQAAFGRVRIRVDIPQAGTYTVTYPYGQKTYTITAPGIRAIDDTVDIGCFSQPGISGCDPDIPPGNPNNYNLALQTEIGPFLVWDNIISGQPWPAVLIDGQGNQYIGNPLVLHAVTGSPTNNNFFRVQGPNIGGAGIDIIETDLFTVQGKVHNIPPAVATHLVFTSQPDNSSIAGQPFSIQPVVEFKDDAGNTAVSASGVVTLRSYLDSACSIPKPGLLPANPQTQTATAGVAAFSGTGFSQHIIALYLRASSPGVAPACSAPFKVTFIPAAYKLAFVVQPSEFVESDIPFAVQPVVQFQDSNGVLVATETRQVTIEAFNDSACTIPAAFGLSGNAMINATNGNATFADLARITSGGPIHLKASAAGIQSACSQAIYITGTPLVAAKLAFVTQPNFQGYSGQPFSVQPVIAFQDANGNNVTNINQTVMMQAFWDNLCTVPITQGQLLGTAQVQSVEGFAHFTDLSHTIAGGAIYIGASSQGMQSACSRHINMGTAVPVRYNILDPFDGIIGNFVQVQVNLEDEFGNPVFLHPDANTDVTLDIRGLSSGDNATVLVDIIGGIGAVNIRSMIAETVDLSLIDSAGTGYDVSSTQQIVFYQAPQRLQFMAQPNAETINQGFVVFPKVGVYDAQGGLVPLLNTNISIAAFSDAGCTIAAPGTLSGTTTLTTDMGIVEYDDISYDTTGMIYLKASAAGYDSACSFAIDMLVQSQAVKFAIIADDSAKPGNSFNVTIEIHDAQGLLVIGGPEAELDVTLHASGSAAGAGLVQVSHGRGTIELVDDVPETITLSLEDTESTGLDVSSTHEVVVRECNPGATRKCDDQDGACQDAVETCSAQGVWPGCTQADYSQNAQYQENEYNVIDGIDNDCDGIVDNDNEAPEIEVELEPSFIVGSTLFVSGTTSISVEISDLGVGVDNTSITYQVGSGAEIPLPYDVARQKYFAGNVDTRDAVSITIRARDLAGNQNLDPIVIIVDSTAPITDDDFKYGDIWQNQTQLITLNPDCGLSGCARTKYCFGKDCDPIASGAFYTSPIQIATEGETYLRYASMDNVGNLQDIQTKKIKIDNDCFTQPNVVFDVGEDKEIISSDASVKIRSKGNVTGSLSIKKLNDSEKPAVGIQGLGRFIDVSAPALAGNIASAMIKVPYSDAEVAAAGLDENSLRLWYFNETSSTWHKYEGNDGLVPDGGVDTANNFVWALTDHFSIWAVGGSAPALSGSGSVNRVSRTSGIIRPPLDTTILPIDTEEPIPASEESAPVQTPEPEDADVQYIPVDDSVDTPADDAQDRITGMVLNEKPDRLKLANIMITVALAFVAVGVLLFQLVKKQ